jgi:hypothetical protein
MSIEREVLDAFGDADCKVERLFLLVDEFRGGRDIGDLITLINSNDQVLVEFAAYIAGEIRMDPVKARPLIARLRELVNHDAPVMRFYALGGLFPFLDIADPPTMAMLTKMISDPNAGVSARARAALTRLLKNA